jgi:MJ1316 RNA cyclic group end recognition domain
MFVSLSRVNSPQLPKNITTPPVWPDGGIEPYEDLSDDEDIAELSDYDSDAAFVSISSKAAKKNRSHQLKGRDTPHVPAPKLRTSSDVYHRILWDRELNAEDYLIGYEDRFSGLKEMPLPNWKRDVEHEDFVSQILDIVFTTV